MLALILVWVLQTGTLSMGQDPAVQRAIETFEPAWLPPEGQMRGMAIVLDPAGGGAQVVGQRRRDRLSLWTAAHLHHLIKRASGRAVLTRMDDRPMATGDASAAVALARRCERARAHLLVTIAFSARPEAGDAAAPAPPLSRSLAETLAEATGVETIPASSTAGLRLPAVTVYLPDLEHDTRSPSRLPRHHRYAERLYKGIAATLRVHRGELEAGRSERWPKPESDEPESFFIDPESRRRHKLGRLARSLWPGGEISIDKAAWFASVFRRAALSDTTAVHFQPEVSSNGDTIVIDGATSVPVLMKTMEEALRAVGVKHIRNRMRLLPDEHRLDGKLFGVCRVSMALTFREPDEASLPQTQLLFGELIFLLDRESGFLLVQAGDGYCGWVRQEAVEPLDRRQFRAWTAPKQAVLADDLEQGGTTIPRGARLPITSCETDVVTLTIPGGRSVEVAPDKLRVIDHRAERESRIWAALGMLHAPYVLGGRSPIGLDCSGLVTNILGQEGWPTARDAAQQFLSGRLVATSWYRDGIRPGDRLYFINDTGKIFHTGIALSATHFVHACPPEVQISSLRKGDRLYDEHWDRTFLAAKRP